MTRRDFTASLSAATDGLGERMPDEVTRRLRARLGRGGTARRVRWGRVAGVAVVVLALGLLTARDECPPLAPLQLAVSPATPGEGEAWSTGVVRDETLGSVLELDGPAKLRRTSEGVELFFGAVTLDVNHDVVRAVPYRVRVSHGLIEVLGTRFTVVQRWDGGEVTLHRGSIRFTAQDGQTRLLAPGETLRWPLAPPASVKRAVRPRPRPAPPATPQVAQVPAFELEAFLERVAVLRSRGQYEEAVVTLAQALRSPHAAGTDERLSFELGAILSRQLHDSGRACEHWRAHRERFERGRYESEIAAARSELRCAD